MPSPFKKYPLDLMNNFLTFVFFLQQTPKKFSDD